MHGSDIDFVIAVQQPTSWGQRFRNLRVMVNDRRDKFEKFVHQRRKSF